MPFYPILVDPFRGYATVLQGSEASFVSLVPDLRLGCCEVVA
jgi:hypothetical protein